MLKFSLKKGYEKCERAKAEIELEKNELNQNILINF